MVAVVLEEEVARQQRPPPLPTTTKEPEPPQSRNFRRPCNSANLVSASAVVAAAASYSEILCQNYAAVKRKSPAFFFGALENLWNCTYRSPAPVISGGSAQQPQEEPDKVMRNLWSLPSTKPDWTFKRDKTTSKGTWWYKSIDQALPPYFLKRIKAKKGEGTGKAAATGEKNQKSKWTYVMCI